MNEHTHVLVVGGGPAGSTAATLLAREGFQVILLERDQHPREHIGESLLPSILNVLDLIGAREKAEAHGFVKKWGGYLEWGEDTFEINFGDPAEPDQGYGFQVIRSEFDHLLIQHAETQGVDVRQNVRAAEVLFTDGRATSVRWTDTRDATRTGEISFDYLIDASGRAGLMATKYLGGRRYNEGFRNIAAYSYWTGTKQPKSGPPGAIQVAAVTDGWLWAIPLHDGTLSVGVVAHKQSFQARRDGGRTIEQVYADALAESPLVSDLIEHGTRVRPIQVEQDFSYICEESAGPGYFIAGDAASFLDPLLSTGVHLATFSATLASAGVSSILRGELAEQEVAEYYRGAYQTAYIRFLVLVSSLYLNYRGKKSLFWEAHEMSREDVGDGEVIKAFWNVVSGLEDLGDADSGASALVFSEMRRLIDVYFAKDSGRDDAWLATLPEDERRQVLDEVKPLVAPNEYALSEETALNGFYVRTTPHLALVRVGEQAAAVER
ncbi:NAD(P)/FAD-dependent oxidoreductase [Herbidospora yilanensis]|uniref:NAD(P)/FAD-dependent oxidoreductase n=1 Tax=Herbidospora yilanensis TaxID=354426 RepID=UPI0007807F19|nr:NAD(P)/FAD-dependent oxidoreductase [Herbidospora yilanensis]